MHDWTRNFLKVLPLGVGFPLVLFFASVKPGDAVSNLAGWASWLGVQPIPDWLANPAIDNRVITSSALVAVAYAFIVWGVPALQSKKTVIDPVAPIKPVPRSERILEEKSGEPEKIEERIFVNVTPDYLIGLYRQHLHHQAEKLASPFIGKWITVTAPVYDVNMSQFRVVHCHLQIAAGGSPPLFFGLIAAFFDRKWADRLNSLIQDQNVTLSGQIKRVDSQSIVLEQCELK